MAAVSSVYAKSLLIVDHTFIHGKYQVNPSHLLPLNQLFNGVSSAAGGHSFKLEKRHCKLNVRENVGYSVTGKWTSGTCYQNQLCLLNQWMCSMDVLTDEHCCQLRYCTAIDDLWKTQWLNDSEIGLQALWSTNDWIWWWWWYIKSFYWKLYHANS